MSIHHTSTVPDSPLFFACHLQKPPSRGTGAADLPEAGGPPGHWQLVSCFATRNPAFNSTHQLRLVGSWNLPKIHRVVFFYILGRLLWEFWTINSSWVGLKCQIFESVCKHRKGEFILEHPIFGQIIATSHDRFPPNGKSLAISGKPRSRLVKYYSIWPDPIFGHFFTVLTSVNCQRCEKRMSNGIFVAWDDFWMSQLGEK